MPFVIEPRPRWALHNGETMNYRIFFACLMALAMLTACGEKKNNTQNTPDCPAGTFGCECLDGDVCNDGLVCFNAVCTNGDDGNNANNDPPDAGPDMDTDMPDTGPDDNFDGLGLTVTGEDARACEVLITDAAEAIASVGFANNVEGRSQRRGQKLAVAFTAKDDEPLIEGDVSFVLKDGVENLDGVTLSQARCFDRQGAVLQGTSLEVVDKRQ